RGRAPDLVAQQLCDGGSDLIQLRAKESSVSEIRAIAEKILPITSRAGVILIINDHPAIALELAAHPHSTLDTRHSTLLGCHLGQEDFFDGGHKHVSELKTQPANPASTINYQPSTVFGLSSHSPSQATRAVAAGADYIAVGPV